MPFKILVTSRSFRQSSGKHWEMLRETRCEVVDTQLDRALTEDEMIEWIRDVDGAILGVDPVTAKVVKAARRLKVISRQGVGVDTVDIAACTERGIVVTNTPGASTASVAEMTIALIFALLRCIPHHDRQVKAGKWSRILGTDLNGKTVAIVGLGRIGQDVARKLKSFQVELLYHDPVRPPAAVEKELRITYVPLDELLARADVICLHAQLNAETAGLIDRERLARVKPTAILVNTARGELVDEPALAEALKAGKLAGAASDVFATEPPTSSPLLALDNFVASPHCAAYTRETNTRVAIAAAENLAAVLRGERPASVVNPQVFLRLPV